MCAGIVDGNTKRQNAANSPIISRTWFRANSGNTIAYEYRLKGATSDQQSGRIRASFDESGDKPLMVEASFTHYLANIDLVEGKMHLKLDF